MINSRYYILSDMYTELFARELSLLTGRKVRITISRFYTETEIQFLEDQSYTLLAAYHAGSSHREVFLFCDDHIRSIIAEIKKRGTVKISDNEKPDEHDYFQEALYRCLKPSVELYGYMLGSNVTLSAVQAVSLGSVIGSAKQKQLIKQKLCFTIVYCASIDGLGSFHFVHQVPKRLYRDAISTMYDENRSQKISNDFCKKVGEENLNKFDEAYQPLVWIDEGNSLDNTHQDQSDDENDESEEYLIIDSSEFTVEQEDLKEDDVLVEEIVDTLYTLIKDGSKDTEEEDIILEDPQDFFLAQIFMPKGVEMTLKEIFGQETTVTPVEIKSLWLSKIKKESPGFLAILSYAGSFIDQTGMVFSTSDSKFLSRVQDHTDQDIIEKMMKPGARILSILTKHNFKSRLLRYAYTQFTKMNVANDELALRVTYQLNIGAWRPMKFRQYFSMSFINSLLIALLGEDRLAWIKANKRNLLLSIMDLNAVIREHASDTKQLQNALSFREPKDVDFGDPLDTDGEEQEGHELTGFLLDFGLLAGISNKVMSELVYKFQAKKKKDGTIAEAFKNSDYEVISKLVNSVSSNMAIDLLRGFPINQIMDSDCKRKELIDFFNSLKKITWAEFDSSQSYYIRRSRVAFSEFMYSYWLEKDISVGPKIAGIFKQKQITETRTEAIEIERIFKDESVLGKLKKAGDLELQFALPYVPREDLTIVLAYADRAVKDKLYNNMSINARKLFDQDVEAWGNRDLDPKERNRKAAKSIMHALEIINELAGTDLQRRLFNLWMRVINSLLAGDFSLVIERCKKAITLVREHNSKVEDKKDLEELGYEWSDMIAWTYANWNKNLVEAIVFHKKSIELASTNFAKSWCLDTFGFIRYRQKKYDEALELFTKAQKYSDQDWIHKHIELTIKAKQKQAEKKKKKGDDL